MRRVVLAHDYDAPPGAVWALAVDFAALARAMRGLVTFRGLPEGRIRAGQVIEAEARLLGVSPWRPHRMEVEVCDDAAMTFQSRESGPGLRRWDHRLTVASHGTGARLSDVVEVEADRPWQTPILARWARIAYRRRHAARRAMLDPDRRPT
ncbi:MAG: SRPBCC family protein [Shimia sp.]